MNAIQKAEVLEQTDFYGVAEKRIAQVQIKGNVVRNKQWNLAKFFAIGGTVTISSVVIYHVALLALVNSLNLMPY